MEGTCNGIIKIIQTSSVIRDTCGQPYSKTKRAFKNTGPLCPDCTSKAAAIKKINNKIANNNALLLIQENKEAL